jgi:hypothetical protein
MFSEDYNYEGLVVVVVVVVVVVLLLLFHLKRTVLLDIQYFKYFCLADKIIVVAHP